MDALVRILNVSDYLSYVREFRRVLKRGGQFFIHLAQQDWSEDIAKDMAQWTSEWAYNDKDWEGPGGGRVFGCRPYVVYGVKK